MVVIVHTKVFAYRSYKPFKIKGFGSPTLTVVFILTEIFSNAEFSLYKWRLMQEDYFSCKM